MSCIRYQFYRMKPGIISSIQRGLRGVSKGSALSLPVKANRKLFAYPVQETSQALCTSASRVPRSSAGTYCVKRGAPIRRINRATPLTVQSSLKKQPWNSASSTCSKKVTGVESSSCTVRGLIVFIYFRMNNVFRSEKETFKKLIF